MAEAAIEFRGFSKSFGSTTAVEDVSFSVEPGRVVGLLGENGAGKTTCIRGLLGRLESDAGDALIFGKPFSTRREKNIVGTSIDGIGFTPDTTVRRELMMGTQEAFCRWKSHGALQIPTRIQERRGWQPRHR